jgi:hypothetical protein
VVKKHQHGIRHAGSISWRLENKRHESVRQRQEHGASRRRNMAASAASMVGEESLSMLKAKATSLR